MDTTRRRTRTLLAAVSAALATTALSITPASAAVDDAQLLTKTVGSLYSTAPLAFAVTPPGKAATYGLELKNTGTESLQYRVLLVPQWGPAAWQLAVGSTAISRQSYYTPPVAPGKTFLFTVKATPPMGTPSSTAMNASVEIFLPDTSTFVTSAGLYLEEPQTTGTSAHDVYLRNGAQPWVSGANYSVEQSPAARPGNTETFSLKVQNDTGSPSTVRLYSDTDAEGACTDADFAHSFKIGSVDITAAMDGAGFDLALAAHAVKAITLTVKYLVNRPGCTDYFIDFQPTTNELGVAMRVPVAAN